MTDATSSAMHFVLSRLQESNENHKKLKAQLSADWRRAEKESEKKRLEKEHAKLKAVFIKLYQTFGNCIAIVEAQKIHEKIAELRQLNWMTIVDALTFQRGTNLSHIDWSHCIFEGDVDFTGCDLSGANFEGAIFRGKLILTDANVRGLNLKNAEIEILETSVKTKWFTRMSGKPITKNKSTAINTHNHRLDALGSIQLVKGDHNVYFLNASDKKIKLSIDDFMQKFEKLYKQEKRWFKPGNQLKKLKHLTPIEKIQALIEHTKRDPKSLTLKIFNTMASGLMPVALSPELLRNASELGLETSPGAELESIKKKSSNALDDLQEEGRKALFAEEQQERQAVETQVLASQNNAILLAATNDVDFFIANIEKVAKSYESFSSLDPARTFFDKKMQEKLFSAYLLKMLDKMGRAEFTDVENDIALFSKTWPTLQETNYGPFKNATKALLLKFLTKISSDINTFYGEFDVLKKHFDALITAHFDSYASLSGNLGVEHQHFFNQKNRMAEAIQATALVKRTIEAVANKRPIDENDMKKLFLLSAKPFVWMGSAEEKNQYVTLCTQNNNLVINGMASFLEKTPLASVFVEKRVADDAALFPSVTLFKDFLNTLFGINEKLEKLASIAMALKGNGQDISGYKEALKELSAFNSAIGSSVLKQKVDDDLTEKRDITAPAEDTLWEIIPATQLLSIIANLQASLKIAKVTPELGKLENTLEDIKKSFKTDVKKYIVLEERRSITILRKMSFFSDRASSNDSTPRSVVNSFQPS